MENEVTAQPVNPAPIGAHEPRLTLKLADTPGIRPEDAMSEAGRKILFHQFEIMLKHEPGARAGASIEAIHDMRVATRRMRSAIKLFAPYYKRGSMIGVFNTSLKNVAAALGAVRDLDVFQEKIDKYTEALPGTEQDGLRGFHDQFNTPVSKARETLIQLLDSGRFRDFVAAFYEFLTTPGTGSIAKIPAGTPHLVRHVVPLLCYEQFTAMRAYETILGVADLDTLHQLRIAGKRFRYTLEFFSEVLGPEQKTVVAAVKALQDHLGDLQDARVAAELLQDYLKKASERDDMRPVLQYLTSREAEKQRLLNTLHQAWGAFMDAKTRQALALSVSVL